MSVFRYTKLEEGEMMVIGPVTLSSSSSVSFSAGGSQSAQVSQSSRRKIGITDRRLIIEQDNEPRATRIIPNRDVKRVYVKRKKVRSKIEKIETHQGQTVKLDLPISPREEPRLFDLFPQAEIGERKGLFGRFAKLSPRPAPTRRQPPSGQEARSKPVPAAAKPVSPPAGGGWPRRSHIDDPDIQTLEDLRRYYPLSDEYDYVQAADGDYRVKRLSDGAEFPMLIEEELMGFDVPVQDPKRRKVTIEIFKKK